VLAAAESEPARYLLKPVVVGRLIETAAVKETDRVLDIGCATGYSTAILARIAKSVTALEEEPTLAAAATANLAVLKVANATVVTGPLADGAAGDARFDVILINGAVEDVPPAILAQLAGDGRLVCVMQRGPVGQGTLFTALSGGHASGRSVFGASAPFLPGFTKAPAFVF